jgi:nucleotide-binding universal stress UspA family protein
MLERILVPLDGSIRAEAILTELRVLLARHDSEVVLLRVVVPPTTMNPPEYARLLDERRADARAYIQRMVGELAGAGATARGVVYEGYPADAILAGAREQAATLIALTTHGRTGLARWDLGSVTEKVLHGASSPSWSRDPSRQRKPVPPESADQPRRQGVGFSCRSTQETSLPLP